MTHRSTTTPDSLINHASAIQYWNSIPATVNGMLGGYPQISRIDLRGSANFVAKLRRLGVLQIEGGGDTATAASARKSHKLTRGVDCGAGIGRVTEGLLGKVCQTVDVVEPVEKFAQVIRDGPLMRREEKKQKQNLQKQGQGQGQGAKEDVDEEGSDKEGGGLVEDVYIVGLEDWEPSKKYDLIWNQWCVGHLTDAQLVAYLRRAASALTPNGLVVLKENNSTDFDGKDVFDAVDNAVTRTDESFRRIFKEAGLVLFKSEEQLGFPKHLNLLPVRYYALRRPLRPT